jgi:class 3 adenylate cyclase/tetratricopeptide (TPR) repeat protein
VTYTPRHLVEKVLTSKGAIEGERKQVTVLFTDVSGFTAMSSRLDPEDVHEIMDRCFDIMLRAVHRYEGTINQFLGDGVMALFGAPIAHEDHPHRALRAALAIQRDLAPLSEDVRRAHGVEFRMRIGVNTGLVVVGAIGKDLRMDYTAVGDTTNLASRLLNLAQPGQIVLGRQTQRLTEGYFTFDDLGDFQVKGKTEPVHAYAVTGERAGRTRLEVSKERGLTPLVGRQEELARLRTFHRRAESGQATMALVAGDPGVGKSRLLYEFLHGLDPTAVLTLETSCLSYGRSMPYHPVLALVRALLGVAEGAVDEELSRRARAGLEGAGLADPESETLLLNFMGAPVQSELLVRLHGPQLKERTVGLLTRMLLHASEGRPLVMVVDNIHWADDSSLEFLEQLTRAVGGRRALLVLSARPGFAAPWLDGRVETIALGGLTPSDVRGMIRTLTGAPHAADDLVALLIEKSEGNPLFVEEILRQLQETRAIAVVNAEARLEHAGVTVPETIHAIIAARVDRLAEPLKLALQPAAVVGRQFPVGLVATIADEDGAIAPRFAELHRLDFVFPAAREPELLYAFKHALTQEVVYAGLLERRRRRYHGAIMAALEAMHAARTEDVVELLAYHSERSADAEKAVDYAIRAAEKAQRRWASAEALAHFEAALGRLDAMPDTETNRLRRIDAVVKQSEIKFALGRHAEQVQALEAIRGITLGADLPRRVAWLCWTGFLHSLTGARLSVPIAYCTEAVTLADVEGLDDMRAMAECCLTHVYVPAGRLPDALETGERALAFFESRGNIWWACRTLWGLSMACNAIGLWDRSLGYCRRGFEHGRAVNDLRLRVVGLWRTGSTHILRGDAEAGVRYCDEALALSPASFDAATARALKGYGLAKAGRTGEGIALLEEVATWLEHSNLRYTRALIGLDLAESYMRAGEYGRARALAETAIATSRDLGYLHLEGWAERLIGECISSDDPAGAAEHLERAARILERSGARNELAKVRVAQAERLAAAGDSAAARPLLDRACATFEELGTVDGPDRARALLATLGG